MGSCCNVATLIEVDVTVDALLTLSNALRAGAMGPRSFKNSPLSVSYNTHTSILRDTPATHDISTFFNFLAGSKTRAVLNLANPTLQVYRGAGQGRPHKSRLVGHAGAAAGANPSWCAGAERAPRARVCARVSQVGESAGTVADMAAIPHRKSMLGQQHSSRFRSSPSCAAPPPTHTVPPLPPVVR